MGKKDYDVGNLEKCMGLKNFKLINVFEINDSYIIGIYKRTLSNHDIVNVNFKHTSIIQSYLPLLHINS